MLRKKTFVILTTSVVLVLLLAVCAYARFYFPVNKNSVPMTELSDNIAASHPDWKILPDTLRKEVIVKAGYSNEYEVPFRFEWVNAIDSTDTYRIAYYKLERTDASKVVVSDINFRMSGVGFISGDKRRTEIAEISFGTYARSGIRTADYCHSFYFNALGDYELLFE
ncbi:MAG: hypothetical protein LBN95_11155 [Prevotellaceae bacterium]|jgi:hypothetical protein|nr:hypothetical protein [Prevotellaceae bacterium]